MEQTKTKKVVADEVTCDCEAIKKENADLKAKLEAKDKDYNELLQQAQALDAKYNRLFALFANNIDFYIGK